MRAMEQWVEGHVAPEHIIAKHYSDGPPRLDPSFERPLCVYPKLPRYNGSGDVHLASSWGCAAPPRFRVERYLREPPFMRPH